MSEFVSRKIALRDGTRESEAGKYFQKAKGGSRERTRKHKQWRGDR